jgi:hypothetical protein
VHSRFKKDQSGNRRGPRPKSRPALLVDALKKKVVATIDGERREITPPRGKEVRVQTVGGPQVALSEVLRYKICEWRPSSGYGRPL